MLELLLFTLLGVLAGIGMGLLPGIHPNMVILLVPFLASIPFSPFALAAFIVGMGVANSFFSFLPSIFLGASDSETLLSTYPGHRMLLAGRGYEAVSLSVFGGLASVAISLALLPLLFVFLPSAYEAFRPYIWLALVAMSAFMVLSERKPAKIFVAAVCFSLAGAIGLLSLSLPLDSAISLFPVLSGLFGVPVLLSQLRQKSALPEQVVTGAKITMPAVKRAAAGTAGGIVAGFLPGIGSTEIASLATAEKNDKSFLITLGAITTANIIMSFLAVWLIGNPRSGVAVAVSLLMPSSFALFLLMFSAALLAAAVSAPFALFMARRLAEKIASANYQRLGLYTLVFITIMVFAFSGFLGLLLLFTCSALGVFTSRTAIKRGLLMGVLVVPTVMFFVH